MGRMSGILPLRMIKALARLGWSVVRSRGAHHALKKPGQAATITVSVKKGKTLPEGTARGILKDAGVSEDEFFGVY